MVAPIPSLSRLLPMVLGGFLLAPAPAAAQNVQVYAGLTLAASLGRTPGFGVGLDLSSGAALLFSENDWPWGPVAGPFLRGMLMTAHPPSVTAGMRAGVVMATGHVDCTGYMPLVGVDVLAGYRFASRGGGLRAGASASGLLFGMLEGTSGLRPSSPADPELALTGRFPLVTSCIAGRPVRTAQGVSVVPERSTSSGPAADWARRAQEEASSVAEFVRIARSLANLGAPRDLVHRSWRAAREEAVHALLCASMAARLSGAPVALGPMTVPSHLYTPLEIALSSLLDGVMGEALAAREALSRALSSSDPEIAWVEALIAREEASHATLSGDLLGWALARGISSEDIG
jgi:hypothetical protein